MKTPKKRTCRDCLFFTSYSSADPDGRCGEGCGTYGTHTKGSEAACNAFMLSSAAASARRKRKNRMKQLKRTIARLRWENFHMKIDLHIPVNISYDEYHSRRVDFTEKKPETYFDWV